MPVTLITGASTGFGFRTARLFASRGHTVYASMRTPDTGVFDGVDGDIHVPRLDVTEPDSVTAAVDAIVEAHGRIDVLVNNAGIGAQGPIEDISDDETRRAFDVNVHGLLTATRAVLPTMRAQGSGAIVNLSSIAGVVVNPFAGVYSATKFAVEAITEALHFELKQFGIRTTSIEPGGFPTSFDANRLRAAGFDEASPYFALANEFAEARTSIAGREADPEGAEVVADAIWNAVHDDEHRLRIPVGDDAVMLADLRASTDFAGYEQAVRSVLNFWN